MTRASPIALRLLTILCILPGFARALEIEDAYLREMPPGQTTSAMYMTLRNTSEAPVRIVEARVEEVDTAEIHEHRHEEGMMRMQRVEALDIAAGASLSLAPGGYHLMLFGVRRHFAAGDEVPFCLRLAGGAEQCARARVKALGE